MCFESSAKNKDYGGIADYGDTILFTLIFVVSGHASAKEDGHACLGEGVCQVVSPARRGLGHPLTVGQWFAPSRARQPVLDQLGPPRIPRNSRSDQAEDEQSPSRHLDAGGVRRARPTPIGSGCSQLRLDGIQRHVAESCDQVRFIHGHAAEPPLKQMASHPQSCVDVTAVSTMRFADGPGQTALVRGYQDQVHMVRHQAVGPDVDVV